MKWIRKRAAHIVAVFLLLGSACLTVFRYRSSVYRVIEAAKDFALSMKYYFLQFFMIESTVSVTELPDAELLKYLPFDVNEILRKFRDMWKMFFNGNCFLSYWQNISDFIYNFSMIVMLLVPCLLILWVILKKILLTPNADRHGKKSKSIVFIEKRGFPVVQWLCKGISAVFGGLVNVGFYKWSFILIWLLNFNVLTIFLEFLAYYFYFATSFDFLNLPIQLVKLLLDVIIMLSGAPLLFWLVVAYAVVCFIRIRLGERNLAFLERLDRSFIEHQPLMLEFVGTMGNGKTSAMTSVGISLEIMFREKALELMSEIEMKYPNFPWIVFEGELKRAIYYHQIVNLTGCKRFVGMKKARWIKGGRPKEKIFGYDVGLYRSMNDDALSLTDVWKALEDYACLYFIYVIESSLLVSNYSVRVDGVLNDGGNFPLWEHNLFGLTPSEAAANSRHAHVLDFDILRLGMKVLDENPRSGSFEFGVVLISEIAKERGNQLTLQEIKKSDKVANQKNDLFSYSLKMCRHKATVCGYPFVRFICDEQRPESLSADVRDLLNIIRIESKDATELVMPWFFITELVHDFLYPKFQAFYRQYRYCRGDMIFPIWVGLNIFSSFHNYYKRIYNRFGCNVLNVCVENGTMEEKGEKKRLHLLHKKVYSERFSTDCYRGFFEKQLSESEWGLDDYPEYADTVACIEELDFQNSYFIKDLEEKIK